MFYIPQGDLVPRRHGLKWFMNGREVRAPHDTADYSDRPTERPTEEEEVSDAIAVLQNKFPHWRWDDSQLIKRLGDEMRNAFAATQGESQVSRLRQEGNNPTHGPKFVRRGDPDHELLDGDATAWDEARGKL